MFPWFTDLKHVRRSTTLLTPEAPNAIDTSTKGETMSFPSPDFVSNAAAGQARVEKAKSDLESLQERLPKLQRNREALEVAGKDPAAEIARTRDEIKSAEVELNHAREAMFVLFSEERERYAAARQDLWTRSYLDCVQTADKQFSELTSTLRRMSQELSALKAPPIAGTVSIPTLDRALLAHNAMVTKYKLPSNLSLDPRDSLAFAFEHAVRNVLANSGLELAFTELRVQLNLEPLKSSAQHAGALDPREAERISIRNEDASRQ
jgi:hypothetical protein